MPHVVVFKDPTGKTDLGTHYADPCGISLRAKQAPEIKTGTPVPVVSIEMTNPEGWTIARLILSPDSARQLAANLVLISLQAEGSLVHDQPIH